MDHTFAVVSREYVTLVLCEKNTTGMKKISVVMKSNDLPRSDSGDDGDRFQLLCT